MEINGTIYKILQKQEVTFNDGTKKMKGGFVIMSEGEFPKHVAFELFGEERLSMIASLAVGTPVKVYFYVDSREGRDGKYYTTLRCTNVLATAQVQPPMEVPHTETPAETEDFSPQDEVPF